MEHRDLVNQFLKLKALELKVSRLACFAFPYAYFFAGGLAGGWIKAAYIQNKIN